MGKLLLLAFLSLSEITDSESLRFIYSTEQGFDTSCGLTTLACLMATYWGIPSGEMDLAHNFLSKKIFNGDYTINFADMKRVLEAKGFTTRAFKMDYGQLSAALEKYSPIIIHFEKPDKHFALALGATEDSIVLADPALGLESLGREEFESKWSRNAMLAAIPGKAPDREKINAAIEETRDRDKLLEVAALQAAGAIR